MSFGTFYIVIVKSEALIVYSSTLYSEAASKYFNIKMTIIQTTTIPSPIQHWIRYEFLLPSVGFICFEPNDSET